MVEAFMEKGFTAKDCEFIFVDNTITNRLDAFSAYNCFLQQAKGRYIILCHQDILPIDDNRSRLDALLDELSVRDRAWGICGNAGATASGHLAIRISDPHGQNRNLGGPFPVKVMSLDENFILVRRKANLAVSNDLSGFHWCGADLSIVADILGWNSYVIDFHLLHKSGGRADSDFVAIGQALRRKYARFCRSRWHYVPTIRPVFISASPVKTFFATSAWKARSFLTRAIRKLASRLGLKLSIQ
jgi:hypothetical protein